MPQRDPELGDPFASELARLIRKEIARLQRRLIAIDRDIQREGAATALREQAALFVHSRLPGRGATEIVAVDYAKDPPVEVTAEVDPAIDPRMQVEAWFKTARRYFRGAELGRLRADETRETIGFLSNACALLERDEIMAVERDAIVRDPRIARLQRGSAQHQRSESLSASTRQPFREFLGSGGTRIWVGRGARENDQLTTKVARPHDWFFHVHGAPGAHVIVPRNKGEELASEVLLDAAHLAHHFSSLAPDEKADVAYTERRYVQKRRNSPCGAVHLLRHKVLRLVCERDRVLRLMAAEVRVAH